MLTKMLPCFQNVSILAIIFSCAHSYVEFIHNVMQEKRYILKICRPNGNLVVFSPNRILNSKQFMIYLKTKKTAILVSILKSEEKKKIRSNSFVYNIL